MRVPIENGSGFINQVLDSIKLSAADGMSLKNYLISNSPAAVSSSPQKML